jgi:suppressor of tumorigenicity protein 13
MSLTQNVSVLELHTETVQSYIAQLETQVPGGDNTAEADPHVHYHGTEKCTGDHGHAAEAAPAEDDDGIPFPPLYESGEDFDAAATAKQEAADCKGASDWQAAVDKYTEAILAAPPSALLLANRANALMQLNRPRAAERDCTIALKENPDSAKALRMRGKARKQLELWEDALKDLSASQTIDFDPDAVEDLKFLTEKHLEMEKVAAESRIKEEDSKRKRVDDIKKAQAEAKEEKAREAAEGMGMGGMPGGMGGMPGGMGGMPGGMPGGMGGMPGGMPGGMGGMPGGGGPGGMDMAGMMGALMSDPELVAAMQNPKVQSAFQQVMSGGADPAKMQELMKDPEVGPVLQKLMAKLAPGMAMPGGAAAGGDDDDIPNINEHDDMDLDDLPDLE